MTPDSDTIARRRHTVTIVVRLLIAAYGAWVCYSIATGSVQLFLSNAVANSSLGIALADVPYALARDGPQVVLLVVLILVEKRLVRWIVPMPVGGPVCPKCGYSLKNLRSPVCPECGLNLRGPAK